MSRPPMAKHESDQTKGYTLIPVYQAKGYGTPLYQNNVCSQSFPKFEKSIVLTGAACREVSPRKDNATTTLEREEVRILFQQWHAGKTS